jgi:hypothetical protein
MVEMVVVRVLVVEGHGGERERESDGGNKKRWETDFLATLDLIFSFLKP